MSKMKHILRKLHIGGGGGGGTAATLPDHHPHAHHHPHNHNPGRVLETGSSNTVTTTTASSSSSSSSPVEQQASTSGSLGRATAAVAGDAIVVESVENSNSVHSRSGDASGSSAVADFSFLEEEFQVQLALAMSASASASASESPEDPETTAQIKAAKQISLSCSPSQTLVDFQSLRYWNYDVVNYNEKVIDGFYDVYGTNANLLARGEMPSLVELRSIPALGNVDYEVIIVDRTTDLELQRLEEKAHLINREFQALRMGALLGFFVRKIADIVVEKMGGPVNDAEEMLRRWTARSYELRTFRNSIILPLGSLDVGLSRHRALLFKVLADRINLPCMLVKGSYYTSTDDGAFSIIKFDDGSEHIIDLMGAPGTLIPSEIPSGQLQNCGIDLRTITPIAETFKDSCSEFSEANRTGVQVPTKINSSTFGFTTLGNDENEESKLVGHGIRNVIPLAESPASGGLKGSADSQILVEDFSQYVCLPAKNPELAQKFEPFLFETRAVLSQENSSAQSPIVLGEQKFVEKNLLLKDQMGPNGRGQPELCVSSNEKSIIPISQLRFINNTSSGLDINSSIAKNQGELSCVSKTKDLANCSQSDVHSRDEQIDQVLGGVAEWEIPWEDLQIGERIGIGSFGEVYRSDWNGTEVAVKKFMNQDISSDALAQFKCEVEIMLRLRHPNVVLFMGAVTRPPNLSILTEFLPRGSLFKLLHRSNVQIDERRRLRMALDVAKGMNYLHTSHPVIVHRDLKTPNLLVDKNWVVKVCDFGMSRMKHHTFLSSKSAAGTAEWMAPEVLRNEPSSEKSDVFSFGVILWELATLDVPWTGMNSMQVVGAVGFQGRRLNIPDRVDPVVAEIINNCWDFNQHQRPSFKEIIARLKCLQRLVVRKADMEAKQL
ncbi:OLC1v1029234C2 [Oldenlandia corymbosa var. corymbosa]|uniref:non-specific serine/threonine protein kinase n=1 Tax=Oldenlandia corymbosa var. corymbosa TaxID=529605 RepID=A0AAV1CE12_OLDCO|nr:OLC1v1029234C2 [Oldenlandia corymbosa var. corymbosa]